MNAKNNNVAYGRLEICTREHVIDMNKRVFIFKKYFLNLKQYELTS